MKPVLLVHGYLALPFMMGVFKHRLRALGHDTFVARELSPFVLGDVRFHAEQLGRSIQRVRERTGSETVHLVGASQGGLVAMWHAHVSGWEHVERLVTVGSPLKGSPLARLARPLGRLSGGVDQLQPGHPFLQAMSAIVMERHAVAVSMRRDPVCPPEVCGLPGMTVKVVEGPMAPVAHQAMMLQRRVVSAVHEALTEPVRATSE